jgi:ABC-2 type transport system ATP-binding protein
MSEQSITFDNVSKFYGEVLGVNRVTLEIPSGITSLVGPNGSGKTTLMNMMCGLLRPTRGQIRVLGLPPSAPHELMRRVGYCTQFDSFPPGVTGRRFVVNQLLLHGLERHHARRLADRAIERVGMTDAAHRKVAAYSKGMRQRIKLAHALAHEPQVLVLDEPLNGLDPMARAEVIALFQELAECGQHVLISSHILHEVELMSDRVILLDGGYVIAEGDIEGVRSEMATRPMQVLVRCDRASELASRLFTLDHVVEVILHDDGAGLLVRTRDADALFLALNSLVTDMGLAVERVAPADESVRAVYEYLIGHEGGTV